MKENKLRSFDNLKDIIMLLNILIGVENLQVGAKLKLLLYLTKVLKSQL